MLLAPAGASFDMFTDYADRGATFAAAGAAARSATVGLRPERADPAAATGPPLDATNDGDAGRRRLRRHDRARRDGRAAAPAVSRSCRADRSGCGWRRPLTSFHLIVAIAVRLLTLRPRDGALGVGGGATPTTVA